MPVQTIRRGVELRAGKPARERFAARRDPARVPRAGPNADRASSRCVRKIPRIIFDRGKQRRVIGHAPTVFKNAVRFALPRFAGRSASSVQGCSARCSFQHRSLSASQSHSATASFRVSARSDEARSRSAPGYSQPRAVAALGSRRDLRRAGVRARRTRSRPRRLSAQRFRLRDRWRRRRGRRTANAGAARSRARDGQAAGASRAKNAAAPTRPDHIAVGDHVRIDRIKPFDRKPGLAGLGFTYDNPDRVLPIERDGKALVLHLAARKEALPSRAFAVLRIALYRHLGRRSARCCFWSSPASRRPRFSSSVWAREAPSTYLDLLVPNPWRQVPQWFGDTLRGAARPALLLFALCLIDGDADAPRERVFAADLRRPGTGVGTIDAYGSWLLTYAGCAAAGRIDRFSTTAADAVTALTTFRF